jgi:uncharacterized protein (DUF952 family)
MGAGVALFHIVSRDEWARVHGERYAPASLGREGFVHLSTEAQLVRTAERFFGGRPDLLALVIREDRLASAVRFEPADGEPFPHLYGPLDLDAIEEVAPLVLVDGQFELRRGVEGLARRLADAYADAAVVEAVALGGSRTGALGPDDRSDVDLYVYCRGELPIDARAQVAESHGGAEIEVGNRFWEDGDEWVASAPPVKVDVMFRDVGWTEDEVRRVLDRGEARLGYSTCILHNLKSSAPLFDRAGWFERQQARTREPYPLALRDSILAKNHPVLRNTHSSYVGQIRAAAARDDRVSVNHRVAALLASVFDLVFAANRLPHPGEKRLVRLALESCESLPEAFAEDVATLVDSAGRRGDDVVVHAERLVDRIDAWLGSLGLLPPWPRAAAR